MSNDINLDPARVRSAMARAERDLASARLNEKAALAARAKAAKLAEIWGFTVDGDDVGIASCASTLSKGYLRCDRVEGHAGRHHATLWTTGMAEPTEHRWDDHEDDSHVSEYTLNLGEPEV